MIGWTLTGIIFFIKPGYGDAYKQLAVKTYPIEKSITIAPQSDWQEIRLVQTILGKHILVKVNGSVQHLDANSFMPTQLPSEDALKTLIDDAISHNRTRYGKVLSYSDGLAQTTTGVEVTLDWQSLRLSQKGGDTQLINTLYKIHYLQWTSNSVLNQILGIAGLILLFSLTVLGIRLTIKRR